MPRFRRYLSTSAGQPMTDMILDVPPLSHAAAERVGYSTQKPLSLLDRLIRSGSEEGDIVLDPFCGCGTACVAAETLHRPWIGIDLSELAATLVKTRLRDQLGMFREIHHRTDIPRRTDLDELPNLPDAQARAVRQAGGSLRGLPDGVPVLELRDRPHRAARQGRVGPRRQPPVAMRRVQPSEGNRDAGRADREAQGMGSTGRLEAGGEAGASGQVPTRMNPVVSGPPS